MNDCSFDWPKFLRSTGPCLRPGGSLLTERALEICGLPSGSLVADLGCGAGGTLRLLERTGRYRVVGLDYSEVLLAESANRLERARLVKGRAEILPFKDNSFDAIFCECVLSILDDKVAALGECARVLMGGGFLILSDLLGQGDPGQVAMEGISRPEGPLAKEVLLGHLARLGFSLLLWEVHERLLKEFVARMILAGESLPDAWRRRGECGEKTGKPGITYFLLVARKPKAVIHAAGHRMDGHS